MVHTRLAQHSEDAAGLSSAPRCFAAREKMSAVPVNEVIASDLFLGLEDSLRCTPDACLSLDFLFESLTSAIELHMVEFECVMSHPWVSDSFLSSLLAWQPSHAAVIGAP